MVGIVDYGAGNIRSLTNALDFLKIKWKRSFYRSDLDECGSYILPGVGAFRPAMNGLKDLGLDWYLSQTDKHILGICLGYQLLAVGGQEGGYTDGLGLLPGIVEKLPQPHVGWDYWSGKSFYFTHHYQNMHLPYAIIGQRISGCQFHPEKSQENGLNFLRQWYELSQFSL